MGDNTLKGPVRKDIQCQRMASWSMSSSNERNEPNERGRVLATHVPILVKTRAIWRTKLNSVFPEISTKPFTVCNDLLLSCMNSKARLGSS